MGNRIKRMQCLYQFRGVSLKAGSPQPIMLYIEQNAKYPWRLSHRVCSRSSDLSQFVTPSQSCDQWQVVATLCWNLQQQVLFRIHTGFPFNPMGLPTFKELQRDKYTSF